MLKFRFHSPVLYTDVPFPPLHRVVSYYLVRLSSRNVIEAADKIPNS